MPFKALLYYYYPPSIPEVSCSGYFEKRFKQNVVKMEARQRPRTRIPAPRTRTASMPRQKSVEFSPEIEMEEQKRVRRKWKSFNLPQSPTCAINNNTVDILQEWREELADEQNITSLIKLSQVNLEIFRAFRLLSPKNRSNLGLT